MGTKNRKKCWVGLDWGDSEHSLCVLDASNGEVSCFSVKHNTEGLAALAKRLVACGDVLGIGVETHRHLVVHHLLETGYTIYSINPKIVKTWRESLKAQPSKTDKIDAVAIATGLLHYSSQFKPYRPADPLTRELAMLCEDEMTLIGQRTALVNQLQAALKQYYPQALDFFSDWSKRTAWDFLIRYPNSQCFLRAKKKGLIGFLKTHKIGISPRWEERIESRKNGKWRVDKAVGAAKEFLSVSLCRQLIRLEVTLKAYRQRIDELFSTHPDAKLFLSLPGAGSKLAARLSIYFGSERERFESAEGLQQLSGVVPVSKQTGGSRKKPVVVFRRAVQPGFRATMHLFAFCSVRYCVWAKAFYSRARDNGQTHALALRNLGAKWIKIIYRMWQSGEPYDDARYLHALIAHGSPLVEYMKTA